MSKQRSLLLCLILVGLMSVSAVVTPLAGRPPKGDPVFQEYLEIAKKSEPLMRHKYPGTFFQVLRLFEADKTPVNPALNCRLYFEYTTKYGSGRKGQIGKIVLYKNSEGRTIVTYDELYNRRGTVVEMAGPWVNQDPARQEYLDFAKTAEKLMNEKYPDESFRMGRLLAVETQVVAGFDYKLNCEYTYKGGSGTGVIVVHRTRAGYLSSVTPDELVDRTLAFKGMPDKGIPDGYTKQNTSRQEYLDIAKTAEKLMNEKYPGTDFRMVRLLEVYTRGGAGLTYKLICEYTDKAGSKTGEIVVHKDLEGKTSLTSDKLID